MLCKFFFPFLKASALCCYLLGTALCGVKRLESESHSVMSDSFRPHGLYNRWNSPGQNTGVGSLSLLQGIFPTHGSNPGLPHCRQILHQLSHKGSPRILEWVTYPFSRGSSWPRNGTRCIARRFFTNWAIREAQDSSSLPRGGDQSQILSSGWGPLTKEGWKMGGIMVRNFSPGSS